MTAALETPTTKARLVRPLRFAWLEITGQCQLACAHCYAGSGPTGTHGTMTETDWLRTIDDIADLGAHSVQFIGGEPTRHPGLVSMARHALSTGLQVEVFSNLVAVKPEHWELFAEDGVSLATSYYSDDPTQHNRITKGADAHRRTTANIAKAVSLGIPLRAGIIGIEAGQRTRKARQLLQDMGVQRKRIGYDNLRQVGRGVRDQEPSPDQLCCQCTNGKVAISPTGEVWPCVFSRWLPVGNVKQQPLAAILAGQAMAETTAMLDQAFAERRAGTAGDSRGCIPDFCPPNCGPNRSPDMYAKERQPNHVGIEAAWCDPHMCNPGLICSPYLYENPPPQPRPRPQPKPKAGYTPDDPRLCSSDFTCAPYPDYVNHGGRDLLNGQPDAT